MAHQWPSLQAGNGRGNRCESEDELLQRLDSDGVVYDASDLPAALSRQRAAHCLGTLGNSSEPASNWKPSRLDPHPPSRPLVLRYVRPF
jgi:hypothetical protein